ncbi:MAG: 4-phosphoerythronate dehydrogenase [Muribaculaceae bacterium]|nr:4-phosphoerythronate dehydrogenase [Muribaculaceae bacterium]
MDRNLAVVERNIPFVQGLLEPYFSRVEYLESEDITPEAVKDADALLVRTRTRCDASLLDGSRVQFIATATIGLDHIDQAYCQAHGIEAVNAPGCNAPAVAQYVMASILALINRPISQYTIGIVGVGHVGSIVERWARQLGMRVLVNDPPRQQAESAPNVGMHHGASSPDNQWSTLEQIAAEADIITFHPTLNPTSRHIVNAQFLSSLRRAPIIINAARGPIVDTPALVEALDAGLVQHAVIDTWEGEPSLDPELLRRAVIATPHIAGYSLQGKIRATRMALDSLSRHFGLPRIEMAETAPDGAASKVSAAAIAASYDPFVDTAALKSDPSALERLRNTYPLRQEVPDLAR